MRDAGVRQSISQPTAVQSGQPSRAISPPPCDAATMRDWLASLLRGAQADWQWGDNERAAEVFLAVSQNEGVQALLDTIIRNTSKTDAAEPAAKLPLPQPLPAALGLQLRFAAHAIAAQHLARAGEIRRISELLAQHNLDALTLKGAAFSVALYPQPHLRPFNDLDILIRETDRQRIDEILTTAGYIKPLAIEGDLVARQQAYCGRLFAASPNLPERGNCSDAAATEPTAPGDGLSLTIDVHWRLSNRAALSDALCFDKLWEAAAPLPQISPSARTLSPRDALLFACVHLAGHHVNEEHLIWLYDMRLLSVGWTVAEWREFFAAARAAGISRLCLRALILADSAVGLNWRDIGLSSADLSAEVAANEATADYGSAHSSSALGSYLLELRAQPNARAKLRLLRQYLMPSAAYMQARYGTDGGRLSLLGLYLRRTLGGATALLLRSNKPKPENHE